MFWKDREKESIKSSVIFLAIFVIILICAFSVGIFFWVNSTANESMSKTVDNTIQEKVVISLSETQIKDNYIKEINNLKVRIQELNKNSEEILADAEHIFLSVSVPNELRDLHIKRFLEFKALERENVGINELRIRLKEILNLEL